MIAFFLLFLCPAVPAQPPQQQADSDRILIVKRLYDEKRWEEIVRLVPATSNDSAELDFYRGLALARLQRWAEAQAALEAGRLKESRDKRFPIELAGVSYQRKEFSRAKAFLKQALRLDPEDAYASNFLASLYLLEGNVEAAVQYWNRIGRPEITEIRSDPEPRARAALLDRAFSFSPLSVLRLADLRTTQARLENLWIFPRYRFELLPEEEESFTVLFRATERNGWGDSKLEGIFSLLRGLPYQTIDPEFYNLHRSAYNIVSLWRWDAQKRRLNASFSAPLGQDPGWRLKFYLDGRNENWDISRNFQGSTSLLSGLKLLKSEAGAEIRSVASDRWSWRTGVSFAYREFRNTSGLSPRTAPLFSDGFSLQYQAGLNYRLLRNAERRITVHALASAGVGRMLARPLGFFAPIQGSLVLQWFPLSRGDDYEMNSRFRTGRMFGQVPLDELYALGLERDNDLWLRGHIGTQGGKKGSSPMGREYVLWNWEADKIVHQNGFLTVRLGPFVDIGRITDPSGDFISRGWLCDPGVQSKVILFGGLRVIFSYGKDLRSGRNAFYITAQR
ncbi:MAG TPA: tetratricopeptide repeat protein [Candidatus Acidoferrales bacterium]|nr:tetratricopeptide repeat protein [Candidatus Acidoferrales bacterium]